MSDLRPNLLLILTDHWRGDSLGRLGHPVAETPHLDSLSAGGVTFTNAYTPCPSCVAARRSLMTGMTPDSHGMLGYMDGKPWRYVHTMAGELARAGYQTINVGKTHFHPPRLHLGFEELVTTEDYSEWIERATGHIDARFAHGVPGNSWIARPNHLPELQQMESWLTNEAMIRVRKRDPERPFFICLSFCGPHPPWCPPQCFYDHFMRKTLPAPIECDWAARFANEEATYPMNANDSRGKLSPERNQQARAAYYAYLAYIDSQIGRFLNYLGREGTLGNTFVAFSSDHGEMLGDHNLWRKTYAYDASVRVPLIVRPPLEWDTRRNVEDDSVVGWEDIMPSLLEAAGVAVPGTVEGKSVGPLLRDAKAPWRDVYHSEHTPCYGVASAHQTLVSREWKYIWNPVTGEELLFDRRNDPFELCNLADAGEHAAVLAEWRAALAVELQGRPENLSDGERLQTGSVPVWREPTKNRRAE